MGRPVRVFKTDGIYLITNRCREGKFLMRPDPEMNRILLAALVHFATMHEVEILAWCFMSNHFHLIVRAPKLNLSAFMRDFQSKIARKIIDRTGCSAPVFPKRFVDNELVDEESLRDKLQYVVMNPVKHGMVEHPSEWPGLTSWRCHRHGASVVGKKLDTQAFHKFRRRKGWTEQEAREAAMQEREFHATAAVLHDDDGQLLFGADAHRWLADAVDRRCAMLAEFRREGGVGVSGPAAVRRRHPLDKPPHFEPTPAPLCLTTDPSRRIQYREHRRHITDTYQKAHRAWRNGDREVQFPPGTHPPGYIRALASTDDMTDDTSLPPDYRHEPPGTADTS